MIVLMSSWSRLTPALLNNTVEVAPALANLNFDFSLWKIEAPKEFDGVGSALSTARREEAENGMPHTTARKLGALFESILPSVPNVTKAYGQRASEIAQTSSVSSRSSSNYGVFSNRAGSDATSIWAAATSGPPAIAIHLLACLLARMWDGPEATSIWAEIVQRRKDSVRAEMDVKNIVEMTTLAAAKQDITRAQLAEWDASARSWLRTADAVKTRQQKQLMLILDNVKGSVNKMSDTYESVLVAWKNSLVQMEGLVQGISQQAMNGDILLALSAWHLFPDMLVVVPCKTPVHQHDEIFASGGVLTIGLEKPDLEQSGIYWSLPLASLRHYGAPVVTSCSISSIERSRLSLIEFLQAFLGCFLQGWGDAASDTLRTLQWLSYICLTLEEAASAGHPKALAMIRGNAEFSWLNLILTAARHNLECDGNEKLVAKKLILLGRRYGKAFLGLPKAPMFGMLSHGGFTGLLCMEDDRIAFLRKVAQDICRELQLDSHQVFIRYRHAYPGAPKESDSGSVPLEHYNSGKAIYEYATALPVERGSRKRKADNSGQEIHFHRRWLYAGSADLTKQRLANREYHQRLDEHYASKVPGLYRHDDWTSVPSDFSHWHASHGHDASFYSTDRDDFDAAERRTFEQEYNQRLEFYNSIGEEVIKRESQMIEDFAVRKMGIFWDRAGDMMQTSKSAPWFKFLYGDIDCAAIFVLEGKGDLINLVRSVRQDSQDMYSLFEDGKMDEDRLIHNLAYHFQTAEVKTDPYMQSAKAVSSAAQIYRNFQDATIDIRVLQRKLWETQWVRGARRYSVNDEITQTRHNPPSLLPYSLDRAHAFACVTMFESGHYDANPAELENVMAMSSGDSLYVGAALLCDPSRESFSGTIKRISGNIGRPGIAFLVPPVAPLIKQVSINEWPQLGTSDFDGTLKDCFKSTSLHLSFTGASTPVNVGFSGGQDTDVYMLETLVSVHDSGKWIADLNILDTFRSDRLELLPVCADQYHQATSIPQSYHLINIESFLELVDELDHDICLVQAHQNWEARLAASSISIAKGYRTTVTPENMCWQCFGDHINQVSQTVRPLIVIV